MATSWIHLLPQQVAFPAGGSSTAAAPAALGPTSRFSQYMQVPGSRAGFAFVESAPSGMLSPPQAGFGVTEEGVHSIVALGGRKRKLAALLSSPKDDDNMGASAGGRERSDWKRTGGDDENLISLVIGNAAKRQRKRYVSVLVGSLTDRITGRGHVLSLICTLPNRAAGLHACTRLHLTCASLDARFADALQFSCKRRRRWLRK